MAQKFMSFTNLKLTLFASIPFIFGSISHAQLIGVQTYSDGGPTSAPLGSSQTAGVISQSHFNTISATHGSTGTIDNLQNSAGVSTGISFALTGNDDYGSGTGISTANATLLSGQSGVYQTDATYTFTHVPFGLYNLVVYTEGNGSFTAEVELSVGTTSGPGTYWDLEQNGVSFDGNFYRGTATTLPDAAQANYVEFLNVSPSLVDNVSTLQITVPLRGDGDYVGINGLQLEAVPEPPITALMCGSVAVVCFLGARRAVGFQL